MEALEQVKARFAKVVPIVSQAVADTDTRFGRAHDLMREMERICDCRVISTVQAAEPIGPKGLLDVLVIAPATGNTIAKLAHGMADNMLTTVALAAKCKKLVAPSMNTAMLENPFTRENLATLEAHGFELIAPESGLLACGAVGAGKCPSPETLAERVARRLGGK